MKQRHKWVECIGVRFGKLTVISDSYIRGKYRYVRCRCICGTEREFEARNMRLGFVQSCGCLINPGPYRHGWSDRWEYGIWNTMRDRCLNPKSTSYALYGGRGITVCARWLKFENFIEDMGPRPTARHTLERKDNAQGYCKENCVWATYKEQARNRRNQKRYTHNGKTLLLSEWAELLGQDVRLLWGRIHTNGWSVDKAMTAPFRRKSAKELEGLGVGK